MKSIDKLRTAARNMAKGRPLENHEECNLLLIIADEIEIEIADNYMRLPGDADGVPIHVGDEIEFRNGDTHERGIVQCLSDCWVNFGGHSYYGVTNCHHVKPRTLEDVLTEMLDRNTDGVGLREFNRDFGAFVAHYAAEIRELFGGDAE